VTLSRTVKWTLDVEFVNIIGHEHFYVSVSGKTLHKISSESIPNFEKKSTKVLYSTIPGTRQSTKTVSLLREEKEWCLYKWGLGHKRVSAENNPITVSRHCGLVIGLLTCWLKKVNHSRLS
jgi:hypothetical protein